MGSIAVEPLSGFITRLAKKYAIREFVETGTFEGEGAAFAASVFPAVTTIEINDVFRERAMKKRATPTIRFLTGDSTILLPKVIAELRGPAFFWLDAHSGGGFFADKDYCPLLAELGAISESEYDHFIFIDDARAFVAPLPPPFDWTCWPTLTQVLDTVRKKHDYYCAIISDVIMCVPQQAKEDIKLYCDAVRPKV